MSIIISSPHHGTIGNQAHGFTLSNRHHRSYCGANKVKVEYERFRSKCKLYNDANDNNAMTSNVNQIDNIYNNYDQSNQLQPLPQPQPIKIDNRPHEQRVKQQRKARRLNHSFMHLYRHDNPLFDDQRIAPSSKSMTCAKTYLMEYGSFYTKKRNNDHGEVGINNSVTEEMVERMSQEFPPLLELDVKRHLRPKMRFLKYTLGCIVDDSSIGRDAQTASTIRDLTSIPPQYFGARLEKIIAPRHAFLMSKGLPHGRMLLENDAALFQEFLIACRRSKSFCALCNKWREKYGQQYMDLHYEEISNEVQRRDDIDEYNKTETDVNSLFTIKEVEAFDALFTR